MFSILKPILKRFLLNRIRRAQGEWKAKAIEKDSKFKVDLEDMEWHDYDKVTEEVSVQNVVFKISRWISVAFVPGNGFVSS